MRARITGLYGQVRHVRHVRHGSLLGLMREMKHKHNPLKFFSRALPHVRKDNVGRALPCWPREKTCCRLMIYQTVCCLV